MTDIEIAESIKPKKIKEVAKLIGLKSKDLILYGDYKAKINKKIKPTDNKLVLVTAINPTSAGIGKTTVSIGIADALHALGESVCLALREPSLGPVFGVKGGATGGGYSQVIPMADINLHFNGDFHAITSANNLLCSMIDNHIFQGNELNIDPEKILFHRCLDLNDRALRSVTVAQSSKKETPRQDSFTITAASEVMAIMCLSKDLNDLKRRLGNIIVALNKKGKPVYARDLHAHDAMAILLKDAMLPNLVQTLEGTPAIIHLGPFANIAHGCNSINATKLSMSLAKYTITEAGFGADLGAEKFLDLKCRVAGLKPNAVVLVATIQALKLHGGADKNDLKTEDLDALKLGIGNLTRHISIIKNVYKLPLVVTLNKYTTDTQNEVDFVLNTLKDLHVDYAINDAWTYGSKGAIDLAQKVMELCDKDNSSFSYSYNLEDTVEQKIKDVCTRVYGAKSVKFTDKALDSIAVINKLKLNNLPIVIAKTQYSLSDNQKLIGAPTDFEVTIRDIEIRSGAEFLVALAGDMMLMPGLSKTPASVNMKITNSGKISGLF